MTVEDEISVQELQMMERYLREFVDDEPELPNGYCHIRSAIDAVLAWCEVTTAECGEAEITG
jgi:hypothetical protein